MVSREEIVAAARSFIDTPWVHQGRLPGRGLDCVGVPVMVGKTLALPAFDIYETPPYHEMAKWNEFLGHFRAQLEEIDRRSARPGDVLCFRQFRYPCHCGIMSGPGIADEPRFVHSYRRRGRVVEEHYTDQWKNLTMAAFRYPGVED